MAVWVDEEYSDFMRILIYSTLLSCAVNLGSSATSEAQEGPSVIDGIGAFSYESESIHGVSFRVWAPNAVEVNVMGSFNFWSPESHPLFQESGGFWSVQVPYALPGSQYKYRIDNGSEILTRNDARAFDMTNSVGNSVVYDLDAYEWTTSDYQTPEFNDMVIYEMHLGTFGLEAGTTGVGTFNQAREYLDYLDDLGINAIELMPFFEFPGEYSWGYNPSHCYSVESGYGSPDELKRFVDEAHERGIAVLVDLVYSHLGPTDLDLWQYDGDEQGGGGGIYFYDDDRANTPWGDTRPDFSREEVRAWVQDNVDYWLEHFRFDGVRMDGTKYIRMSDPPFGELPEGWSLLQSINDEVNTSSPWKIMIAEDLDNNDWITRETASGGAGFDSQWDARFYWPVRATIEAVNDSDRSMWDIRDAIGATYNNSHTQRVIYTESHDEVANGKSRVPEEIWPDNADSWFSKKRSTLGAGIVFTSPGIPMIFQGQEFLEDDYFSDDDPLDWSKAETFGGILEMYRRMISLRRNLTGVTAGLSGPNLNIYHVNNNDKMIAYHRWEMGGIGDDVVIVANFANTTWNNYRIGFPAAGRWNVHFNSDDSIYDSEFDGYGGFDIQTQPIGWDGLAQSAILNIAPYSVLIFSQGEEESEKPLSGDYDENGAVDGLDLARLLAVWGTTSTLYDLNGDEVITAEDLTILLGNWTS